MTDLLPCPFCGGEAKFENDEYGLNWIECYPCGAASSRIADEPDECRTLLAERWNRRAVPDTHVLLPKIPTEEMVQEARYSMDCPVSGTDDPRSIYRAMIDVALAKQGETK